MILLHMRELPIQSLFRQPLIAQTRHPTNASTYQVLSTFGHKHQTDAAQFPEGLHSIRHRAAFEGGCNLQRSYPKAPSSVRARAVLAPRSVQAGPTFLR